MFTHRFSASIAFVSVNALLLLAGLVEPAASQQPPREEAQIHGVAAKSEFPIRRMWDEALGEARKRGKYAMIFNVDYVDTLSTRFRDSVLGNQEVQSYLSQHFVLGLNDFSVDPPITVGLDSLRNLGLRLSGLEERYRIVVRPTAIILRPDSSEVDRITLPNRLSARQFISRVREIIADRNTISQYIATFWRDTTAVLTRLELIYRFEQRSMYDSVMKHLEVLAQFPGNAALARECALKYAYMRMRIEGKTLALRKLMETFAHSGQDSVQYVTALTDLLEFYKARKKADSAAIFYERIFSYTGIRDPDLLNDYAWELANYTKLWDSALVIVNEALAKRPNEPNYYDTRALVWSELNKLDSAVADEVYAAHVAQPEDVKFFNEQAEYYRKQLEKLKETKETIGVPKTVPQKDGAKPKKRTH